MLPRPLGQEISIIIPGILVLQHYEFKSFFFFFGIFTMHEGTGTEICTAQKKNFLKSSLIRSQVDAVKIIKASISPALEESA